MCFSLCLYECVCLCDLFVSVYVICLSVCVCVMCFSVCVCVIHFLVCVMCFSVCVCLSDLFFSRRLSVCVVCLCVVLLVFVVYTHALHEYLMYLHRQPHTVCPVTFTLTS